MVFPPVLGALMLGLGWREGVGRFGMPAGLAETFLGAVVLLWAFVHLAYGAKILRRPAVLRADLAILPGQVGLGAALMSDYAATLALSPYLRGAAAAILCLALALHLLLIALAIAGMRSGPHEGRGVTPAWHVLFAGPLLGALAAQDLGWTWLAQALLLLTLPVVGVVWALSLRQLILRIPPAPLRPLLCLHPGLAGVLGLVALGLGWTGLAHVAAGLGAAMLVGLLAELPWLTVSGYTAFWGVAGLPLAVLAWLGLRLPGLSTAGGVLLVLATLVALPILVRVLRDWARGQLAAATNAADA
jgi:tellurite resistance protein